MMFAKFATLATFLTTLVITNAPATAQTEAPMGQVQVYDCDNLSRVVIRVFPDRLEWPSMRTALPRTAGSPDPQYTNANITIRMSGNYAAIQEPAGSYVCRSNAAEAPWEEARLRGIDMRAAGDEPMWQLEMSQENGIEFVAEDGTTHIVAPASTPIVDPDMGRTVLNARTGTHVARIVVEQHLCWSRTNAAASSLGVTVTVDGNKVYRGCGRPLVSGGTAGAAVTSSTRAPLTVGYDASRIHEANSIR